MEPNGTSAGMPSGQNDATMQNGSNMTAGTPSVDAAVGVETPSADTAVGVETPSVDAAVGAEAIVASEEIAESVKMPKNDIGGGMMADGSEPKKNGKGMLIGMILFALLAVGGIGFGVWTMMDGNSQTKTLNDQISSLKKTNSELNDKLAEVEENANVNNGGDTIINIDTNSDVNPEDYIYVGEWGIKIKKPEELNMISYLFDDRANETGNSYFYVNGLYGSSEEIPSFINTSTSKVWLGALHRLEQGATPGGPAALGEMVLSVDGYDYYYSSPQAVSSTTEQEQELELKTVGLIKQMLSNPENYSAI